MLTQLGTRCFDELSYTPCRISSSELLLESSSFTSCWLWLVENRRLIFVDICLVSPGRLEVEVPAAKPSSKALSIDCRLLSSK
jgi:hypothetical protein